MPWYRERISHPPDHSGLCVSSDIIAGFCAIRNRGDYQDTGDDGLCPVFHELHVCLRTSGNPGRRKYPDDIPEEVKRGAWVTIQPAEPDLSGTQPGLTSERHFPS